MRSITRNLLGSSQSVCSVWFGIFVCEEYDNERSIPNLQTVSGGFCNLCRRSRSVIAAINRHSFGSAAADPSKNLSRPPEELLGFASRVVKQI